MSEQQRKDAIQKAHEMTGVPVEAIEAAIKISDTDIAEGFESQMESMNIAKETTAPEIKGVFLRQTPIEDLSEEFLERMANALLSSVGLDVKRATRLFLEHMVKNTDIPEFLCKPNAKTIESTQQETKQYDNVEALFEDALGEK